MDLSKQKFDGIRRNIKGKRQILRKKKRNHKALQKVGFSPVFQKKGKKNTLNLMNAKLFPLNPLPWEQCSNCLFYLQHMTIVFFKSNLTAFTVFVRACGGNRYSDVLEKIRFK